jgi:hypothetical protein
MTAEMEDFEAMRLTKEARQPLAPLDHIMTRIQYEGETPANCAALMSAYATSRPLPVDCLLIPIEAAH